MKCAINFFELILYQCFWVFIIVLCFFKCWDSQKEVFERNPYIKYSLRDIQPGWDFISRYKDVSDVEWGCWKYFIHTAWNYMLFQFLVSEMVRRVNYTLQKHWYILSSIIFITLYMGVRQLAVILIQPLIFFVLIINGARRLSIWITSLILLIGYNSLKYTFYFWKFLDDGHIAESDEKVYLLLFGVAWVELKCISYSIDYIESKEKPDMIQEKECIEQTVTQHFINMFSYVLYLPLLYVGPIMLYEEYENSFKSRKEKLWPRLKRFALDMALFTLYTFLLDLAFHFIYFNAMHENMRIISQLPTLALCGGGLWMSFQFYVKYVISYGTTTAFARLDNMEPPPTPRCIARIHVYSQMWRYFDVGLYKFLVKYIYKPSYNTLKNYFGLSKMVNKLLASFCTFTFIFLWHGTVWNIFVWSVLNYCGILLEYTAKALSETQWYHNFKINVLKTEAMETRFIALLCAPLLAVSAVSNFYLFGGSEIGNLFFGLLHWPAPQNVLIVLISTYCCSNVSMSLQNVRPRTDVKSHELMSES